MQYVTRIDPERYTPSGSLPLLEVFTSFWSYEAYGMASTTVGSERRSSDAKWLGLRRNDKLAITEALNRAELVEEVSTFDTPQFIPAPRRVVSRSPAGFMPCVPAYLAGDPDVMFCATTRDTGKCIRVVLNMAISAAVSPEDLLKRGQVVCALLSAMKRQGIRAEFWLVGEGDWRTARNKGCVAIQVLRSQDTIDMSLLKRALCGPSYRPLYLCSRPGSDCGWFNEGIEECFRYMGFAKEECIFLNSVPTWTSDAALKFLDKELERLGITSSVNA